MAKNNTVVTTPRSHRRRLLITVALLALMLGGIYLFIIKGDSGTNTSSNETPINYNPPTDKEKRQTELNKDKVVDRQATENKPAQPGRIDIKPVIVDASQYGDQVEVRAYVPGVIEDGGTCMLTAKQDGQTTITRKSAGIRDASNTGCEAFKVPVKDFGATGRWSVTVSYESAKAAGSSDTATLEIK